MPLPFRITRTLPESISHHAALQQRCQIPRMMSSASIVAMTVCYVTGRFRRAQLSLCRTLARTGLSQDEVLDGRLVRRCSARGIRGGMARPTTRSRPLDAVLSSLDTMTKLAALATAAVLVSSASAHTIFQKLYVDGVDQGELTGIRAPDYDGVSARFWALVLTLFRLAHTRLPAYPGRDLERHHLQRR